MNWAKRCYLSNLDTANVWPQGGQDIMGIMGSLVPPHKVTENLQCKVSKVVQGYIEQGVAEVVPSIVFIDDVHRLDIKCFTYLDTLLGLHQVMHS
jgi:RuvB-like protein 1 (pontin 52)